MNRKALGRGLGALLSSDRTIDLGAEPSEVELDSIVPGPMQPRTHFDEATLEGLAESIRAHGIVQPLLVRRRGEVYELIAGERRWRAAKLAGLTRVPIVVKEVPDDSLLEIALIENIQRDRDVSPEYLGELPVVFVERGPLARFDVEDADHFVVQSQRHRERALRVVKPHHIARIALEIVEKAIGWQVRR